MGDLLSGLGDFVDTVTPDFVSAYSSVAGNPATGAVAHPTTTPGLTPLNPATPATSGPSNKTLMILAGVGILAWILF